MICRFQRSNCAFFLLFIVLGAAQLHAQVISEYNVSQSLNLRADPLSFGGAYRALAETNAAIHVNPAGLALRKDKITAGVDYSRVGNTNSNYWGFSATDSQAIPGATVGFSYDIDQPRIDGVKLSVQHFALSVASEVTPEFLVGGTTKGYLTKINGGQGAPDGLDSDIGFLYKPIPILSFGLTAQNLFNGHRFEEFPFMLGFGAALKLESIARLSVDIVHNFQTQNSEKTNAFFGGEVTIKEGILLRSGFGLDRVSNNNFFSAGLALDGPKAKIVFGYARRLNPGDHQFSGSFELIF